jgi:hypothetical protein
MTLDLIFLICKQGLTALLLRAVRRMALAAAGNVGGQCLHLVGVESTLPGAQNDTKQQIYRTGATITPIPQMRKQRPKEAK